MMQIVESSYVGLRTARMELVSDAQSSKITLFPMVHVGEATFFDQVARDALSHDLVLVEGVPGVIVRRLTRVYRWAGVTRLNLVVQPKLPKAQHVQNADLSEDAFGLEWKKAPLLLRLFYNVGSGCVGIGLRFFGSRARLARHMTLDDLKNRDDILMFGDKLVPVQKAIMQARDENLALHVDRALKDGAQARIAVVYGAGHMPALLRHLRENHGYSPVQNTWLTIFSL